MIKRRNFIKDTAMSAASVALVGNLSAFSKRRTASVRERLSSLSNYDVMKEALKYRKIDAYANAYLQEEPAKGQIDYADRLGIKQLILAVPIAKKMGETPKEFREYNDLVIKAVKRYPNRLAGQLTLHPAYLKESLEEIKRCIGEGMVGMKLYNQFKINNPLVYPVIEQFIHYKMIIHVHGESQLGVGGYRMKYNFENTPTISVPEDFVEIAKRYPEAMFQYAHIGGGGDWEYACKAFKDYPNIYVDTGGSNNNENMVDFAVENLGEDRVFFGCDSSFYQGVGKILSSRLTDMQKRKIFFENYNNILKLSGRNFN
jgi:uncharacterized protein